MQEGQNWIFPKEINANRSSETFIDWKSGPSMGPNGRRVAMDSGEYLAAGCEKMCQLREVIE
jgi:hypothetical protein